VFRLNRRRLPLIAIVVSLLAVASLLNGQELSSSGKKDADALNLSSTSEVGGDSFSVNPGDSGASWGFSNIRLNMEFDAVSKLLEKSADFDYVRSTLSWPDPDSPVISVTGRGSIKKGFFQFHNKRLYSITIVLDENRIDYFTMFTTFSQKYGEYSFLSPNQVKWESELYSLALEKPLTVKYLDLTLHREFIEKSMVDKSDMQLSREQFLKEF